MNISRAGFDNPAVPIVKHINKGINWMEKIALVFPGQGAQFTGMAQQLCKESKMADTLFEQASDILSLDMKKLCFEGEITELTRTENAQPALLTAGYATYKVFEELTGLKADLFAGHSLGEFTSLASAGVLSFENALKIVRRRGELMSESSENGSGGMVAVSNVSADIVQDVIGKVNSPSYPVSVACFNTANQTIISGHTDSLKRAMEKLKEYTNKLFPLNVSSGFHSNLMLNASEKFQRELHSYSFRETDSVVYSNFTGKSINFKEDDVRKILVNQLTSPVQWTKIMNSIIKTEPDYLIEMGGKSTLNRFFSSLDSQVRKFHIENVNDINSFVSQREQYKESNSAIENRTVVSKSIALAVSLKNRNFDSAEYSNGVVKPVTQVKQLFEATWESEEKVSTDLVEMALEMVKSVMNTKRVSSEERKRVVTTLQNITGNHSGQVDELLMKE